MSSRIQQEIRQSKPLPLPVEAHLNLQRTAAALRDLVERETQGVGGLKQLEFNVLRILRGAGPDGLGVEQIRDRLLAPDPMLPGVLGTLANRGFIERQEQRRRITADGLRVLATLDTSIDEALADRVGRLRDDETRTLISLLERLRD